MKKSQNCIGNLTDFFGKKPKIWHSLFWEGLLCWTHSTVYISRLSWNAVTKNVHRWRLFSWSRWTLGSEIKIVLAKLQKLLRLSIRYGLSHLVHSVLRTTIFCFSATFHVHHAIISILSALWNSSRWTNKSRCPIVFGFCSALRLVIIFQAGSFYYFRSIL